MIRTITLTTAIFAGLCTAGCDRNAKALLNEVQKTNKLLADMNSKLEVFGKARPAAAPARPARKRPQANVLYSVPVGDNDPVRGAKHAKVTIVEAFEFACPYCAVVGDVMNGALDGYKPGDVRLVGKQLVVHPTTATDAALGACAAQAQGKFEGYEKGLWAAAWNVGPRPSWKDQEALKRPNLEALAKKVGMNVAKFKTDMASAACKQQLATHRSQMNALGVDGTPALFINGKYYVGPRTPEGLKSAINQELAAADAAISKGVKLEDYYASLVKKGKKTL